MSRLLRTQLKDALKNHDVTRVSGLLENLDIEAINKKINRMTPVHWACQKFKFNDIRMAYDEVQALDLLLAKTGIDVNAKSDGGFRPVHTAILHRNLEALEKLLVYPGIDVNATSDTGYTALHTACEQKNHRAVEKLLACSGIDVNAKTDSGSTPLDIAFEIYSWYYWAFVPMLLTSPGIDIHAKDHNGATLLHKACERDIYEVVKKLLAIPGIDVNAKDNFGNTPIIPTTKSTENGTQKAPHVFALMLDDPRVNLDIKDEEGDGLEAIICKVCTSNEKKDECLKKLKSERMRRERRMILIF